LLIALAFLSHLLSGRGAHELDQLWCELPLLPVLQNVLFYEICRQVGQITVRALLVATQAEEVGICTALALRVAEAEPGLAARTEQRALEVVLMPPGAIAGEPSAGQYLLN